MINIDSMYKSILDNNLPEDVLTNKEYTIQVTYLSLCVEGLLVDSKDLSGAIKALEDVISISNGIVLLQAVTSHHFSPTPLDPIFALESLGNYKQKNEESADAYKAWNCLKALRITTLDQFCTVLLQCEILQGAYVEHHSLKSIINKLSLGNITV